MKSCSPKNTGEKQNGRFIKGKSGNPLGRPKGSLNSSTRAVMDLLESEAEKISRKAIELALDGEIQAIKLIMERIVPRCKEKPISLRLAPLKSTSDILQACNVVISAVIDGMITITEGQGLFSMLENTRRSIESNQFEERIIMLEEAQHGKNRLNDRLSKLENDTSYNKVNDLGYVIIAALPEDSDQEAIAKRQKVAKARLYAPYQPHGFLIIRRQGKDFSITTYLEGDLEALSTTILKHPDDFECVHKGELDYADSCMLWRFMERLLLVAESIS